MAKTFSIKLNVSEIEALSDRMGDIDPDAFGADIVQALNVVTRETYEIARRAMIETINLDDPYVRSRMRVREATPGKPQAEIVAFGDRKMMTGLGHYGALQLGQNARWDEQDGIDKGYKIGPWPKWEPRRGDSGRGLDSGEKQAGFQVEVKRGAQKKMPGAFTIPGKTHTDGSPVLFFGTGAPGRGIMDRKRKESRQGVTALHGPSVYQLFSTAARNIEDSTAESLQAAIIAAAEREIQKVIR